jgi:6-phosphogluconolactonase
MHRRAKRGDPMSEASVVVHADADVLAHAAAARLAIRLVDAQAERGSASVVLTGGGIAAKVYAALREAPVGDAVDWSHVHFWWGDERFLPAGHPDRNETQARAALLGAIPVNPELVHPMPASDGPDGDDPEAAAERYAATLAATTRPGTARLPHFDVVLLGVGEDGHVASVFPEHPVVYDTRPVSAVRGAPKPPPVRITMTLPTINTGEEVWLLAAGPSKADAVGLALAGGGGPVQVPAAGVHGVERTFWLLDRPAAAQVGPKFRSLR